MADHVEDSDLEQGLGYRARPIDQIETLREIISSEHLEEVLGMDLPAARHLVITLDDLRQTVQTLMTEADFSPEEVRKWLTTPNPDCDGKTPLSQIPIVPMNVGAASQGERLKRMGV